MLLLLFDDRRSQNDNNDYYDDGDINISLYWKFSRNRAGMEFYLWETILSFIFNSYINISGSVTVECLIWLWNSVKAYTIKLNIPSFHLTFFKTIYAVLVRIIPKCVQSAKQILYIRLVSLHSQEMGGKERCW